MTDETHLDPDRFTFAEREQKIADAAPDEIGDALEFANDAVGNLADALTKVMPTADGAKSADAARQEAVYGLATLAVRTSCALMLLVRRGWEPEAHALKRRLTEALLRTRAVLDDISGEAARQWLSGRAGSVPASRYDALGPWKVLSAGAHADARSLAFSTFPPPWVDVPDEARSIDLMPRRDLHHAEGLLLETAWECWLLLTGLAESRGGGVLIADDRGERLRDARERYAERSAVLRAERTRQDS